jgi:type I restriction enzyme M protein
VGLAGFILANGSLSSNQSGEGDLRRAIIESDLIDCMVALPGQLFYSTQIPVSLWFLRRDKTRLPSVPASSARGPTDRRGHTLFIDARRMSRMTDRVHAELTERELDKITSAYHSWRGDPDATVYSDELGFCRSVSLAQIREHRYALVPGRYVGFARRTDEDWNREHLLKELNQIEARLTDINRASASALTVLKELLHG